ncbi:hypothetical protein IAU59_002148 [Kwoniella sp. CBS 9459]
MPAKQATVEDAPSSPSPPPPASTFKLLGSEADTEEKETETRHDKSPEGEAYPVTDSHDEKPAEEDEEEWDPAEERLPGQELKEKGKGKEKESESSGETKVEDQPWQAVWAPEQNAWYFWNTKTGEVSWTNPLESASSSESSAVQPPLPNEAPPLPSGPLPSSSSAIPRNGLSSAGPRNAFEAPVPRFDTQPEIDEGLLHMVSGVRGGGGYAPGGDPSVQSASFNARTGQFTPSDHQYTVGHLDEYSRAKRMNSHYFDVEAWEREKAADLEKRKREEESGEGGSRKITRKDMQRFKKKAQEKRARNQAWLRD